MKSFSPRMPRPGQTQIRRRPIPCIAVRMRGRPPRRGLAFAIRPRGTLLLLACALAAVLTGCGPDEHALGERIFLHGAGADGRLAFRLGPRWLGRSASGCAACHGRNGEGRTVHAGGVAGTAPPLTASALAARGYDRQRLVAAIEQGVDPNGRELHDYMPRWQLSVAERRALLRFLETL